MYKNLARVSLALNVVFVLGIVFLLWSNKDKIKDKIKVKLPEAGIGGLTNMSFMLDLVNILVIWVVVTYVIKKNVDGDAIRGVVARATASETMLDSAKLPANRIRARYNLESDTLLPYKFEISGNDTKEIANHGNEKFGAIEDDDMDRKGKIIAMKKDATSDGYDLEYQGV